jgi:general secretion pathway protein M
MTGSIAARLPRSLPFLAVNVAALLFLVLFVVAPLAMGFRERSEQIADTREQLTRSLSLQRRNTSLSSPSSDLLLQGLEEGAVSAALQADLKAMVAAAGAHFLAVRSLDPVKLGDGRLVGARLELEGSIHAVRNVFRELESHVPVLLVSSAVFHAASAEQDAAIRAEIVVQGVMRNPAATPAARASDMADPESGRGG